MKWWTILVFAPIVVAQSIVVGIRTPDGKVSFESVEDFLVNQSRKIRLLPEQTDDVDPNLVRRLAKIDLSQATLVRNDGTGRLVNLNGPNTPRDIVLPENYALRAPTPVKDVPGRLALSLVRSRRNKQADVMAPESFVVVLFGSTPDESVRDFVLKDWAFANVDDQLAAMRGFVASFPSTPATALFRDSLEQRISGGLRRFEAGGPYADLLTTRRFSELARQSYPGDAPLKALDDNIGDRIKFLNERPKLLKSLAALGDWDTLLNKYQDFERYESSFPEMQALHQEALAESARMHAARARAFEQRSDYGKAAAEASTALDRDPSNPEIRKLLGDERVLASQGEALANSSRRKILPKGLPADIRFGNSIASADRAIAGKDFKKAQESLQDAERENSSAPEIILERAKLFAAQGRNSEALPLLDQYDKLVVDAGEREKGYEVRRQVLYDLDKTKADLKQQMAALLRDGQYSKLDALLRDALKLNAEDPSFLYQAGVTAALFRDSGRAKSVLKEFLAHSNAIGVDPKLRDRARIILGLVEHPAAPKTSGTYYDPQSLAFQIPIDNVSGNKVHMTFNWTNTRLDSIRTSFDDDKGAQAYRALVVAGAADSGAMSTTTIGDQGNFFLQYFPDGALRQVLTKPEPIAAGPYILHVSHDAKGHVELLDPQGRPEVALPGHPYVDLAVLSILEGSPAATVVAGNSFFNPFLWDGIHTFTVAYDSLGRADSADEWNADNLVRFTWDGNQLSSVRAYHKNSSTPYYQRTISYTRTILTGEDYSVNGRQGKIRYVYANGGLQQIRIDADNKEWIARPR